MKPTMTAWALGIPGCAMWASGDSDGPDQRDPTTDQEFPLHHLITHADVSFTGGGRRCALLSSRAYLTRLPVLFTSFSLYFHQVAISSPSQVATVTAVSTRCPRSILERRYISPSIFHARPVHRKSESRRLPWDGKAHRFGFAWPSWRRQQS